MKIAIETYCSEHLCDRCRFSQDFNTTTSSSGRVLSSHTKSHCIVFDVQLEQILNEDKTWVINTVRCKQCKENTIQ